MKGKPWAFFPVCPALNRLSGVTLSGIVETVAGVVQW